MELEIGKKYLIADDKTEWNYVGLDDEEGSIGCYHLFLDDDGNRKIIYYDGSELNQVTRI